MPRLDCRHCSLITPKVGGNPPSPEPWRPAATNCVANPRPFRGSEVATALDRGRRGWLSSQARGTEWPLLRSAGSGRRLREPAPNLKLRHERTAGAALDP